MSFRYNDLPANRTVLWREGVPINLRALHEHFFIRPLADHFFLTHPTVFDTRYAQDHLPVREQSAAVGHAVRAMVLYSGMADVAYESGDPQLIAALHRLHDSVTLRRMYVTGGIGPSSKNEGFTDDYDLPNENAYQETCASAGMVLWNYRMFKLTGDGGYVDLLEQSLYNAVLAGVSLEGNTFCYATPLACDSKFRRQPWFEVPCCPTTAARFFPSIGRYIYSQSPDGIWVNLYIGGQARVNLPNGHAATVKQTTNYPWEGRVKLQVSPQTPQEFALRLRLPGWGSGSTMRLNGKKISVPVSKGLRPDQQEMGARRRRDANHSHADREVGSQSQRFAISRQSRAAPRAAHLLPRATRQQDRSGPHRSAAVSQLGGAFRAHAARRPRSRPCSDLVCSGARSLCADGQIRNATTTYAGP